MSQSPVIVLDMNGVLLDIRKRHESGIPRRKVDIFLPNGQRVYMRPGAKDVFEKIARNVPNARIVIYTSRLAKNAKYIEDFLQPELGRWVCVLLHGEDCLKPQWSDNRHESFKPRKTTQRVISALNYTCQESDLVFVDDHPNHILSCHGTVRLYNPGEKLDVDDLIRFVNAQK